MVQLESERRPYLPSALVLAILLWIIIKKFLAKSPPLLPPGPTPWPLLGNIPHMMMGSTMPHTTLTNLAKTYGPLISLKLGTRYWIIGSSPEAATEILKTKDRILSGRYAPHAVLIPQSQINDTSLVWSDCNDSWKYLRTLYRTELFSNKAIESQAELRERNITHLINFMRSKEGQVVQISHLVSSTLFNILGNALMSQNFIALEEDGGLKDSTRAYLESLSAPNLGDFYPIPRELDLQGVRKKEKVFVSRIRAVWEPIIERRRKDGGSFDHGHRDFLDVLLDNGFSNDKINQLFLELFTAATDTSSSTIEWAMAELVRHPECMKKVRTEIESEMDENNFPKNSESLMQLPYLQACIKETLRLYPPAPLLVPHRALEACQLMNYSVPKDAQVMINLWAIGRDPSVWEDPQDFKPERFMDSNIDFKGNDFEFTPFGAGRRMCPGLPMAVRTVPLILISLVHFFDWSIPNGKDQINMREKFSLSIQMEHPLQIVPNARKMRSFVS